MWKGLGPVLQIAEGYTVEIPEEIHDVLDGRTDPTWPTTWFVPNITGRRCLSRCLHSNEQLGCQPLCNKLRSYMAVI
ncbi:hypothetical protein ACT7CW_00370 [Bacillus pacificus]